MRTAANIAFLAAALAGTLFMIGGSVPSGQSGSAWQHGIRLGFYPACLSIDPAAAGCPGAWARGQEPP